MMFTKLRREKKQQNARMAARARRTKIFTLSAGRRSSPKLWITPQVSACSTPLQYPAINSSF